MTTRKLTISDRLVRWNDDLEDKSIINMNDIVLIIEDDPKIRSGLKDNLEFDHFRVIDAWNASLGSRLWHESDPSVVILDLMLPGRDAFNCLKKCELGVTIEAATRTIDVHIAALRRKLKGSGYRIETVFKTGYRFTSE